MAKSDDFWVKFWGVRGSFPRPGKSMLKYGGNTSCLEVRCGARLLIFDAGTGLLARGALKSGLVSSCEADGHGVTTIEELRTPVLAALAETHAVQCGYCFTGMALAAAALIDAGEATDREAIRRGMAGNLCRCTGYAKIIDAVALAASQTGRSGK